MRSWIEERVINVPPSILNYGYSFLLMIIDSNYNQNSFQYFYNLRVRHRNMMPNWLLDIAPLQLTETGIFNLINRVINRSFDDKHINQLNRLI